MTFKYLYLYYHELTKKFMSILKTTTLIPGKNVTAWAAMQAARVDSIYYFLKKINKTISFI